MEKLWLVIRTHRHQGFLQLLGIHCSTPIAVKADEVLSPAIQHSPELLKFIESHGARHISLDYSQGLELSYFTA